MLKRKKENIIILKGKLISKYTEPFLYSYKHKYTKPFLYSQTNDKNKITMVLTYKFCIYQNPLDHRSLELLRHNPQLSSEQKLFYQRELSKEELESAVNCMAGRPCFTDHIDATVEDPFILMEKMQIKRESWGYIALAEIENQTGNVYVYVVPHNNIEGQAAISKLQKASGYRGISLGHVRVHGTHHKEMWTREISLCKEGLRPGTWYLGTVEINESLIHPNPGPTTNDGVDNNFDIRCNLSHLQYLDDESKKYFSRKASTHFQMHKNMIFIPIKDDKNYKRILDNISLNIKNKINTLLYSNPHISNSSRNKKIQVHMQHASRENTEQTGSDIPTSENHNTDASLDNEPPVDNSHIDTPQETECPDSNTDNVLDTSDDAELCIDANHIEREIQQKLHGLSKVLQKTVPQKQHQGTILKEVQDVLDLLHKEREALKTNVQLHTSKEVHDMLEGIGRSIAAHIDHDDLDTWNNVIDGMLRKHPTTVSQMASKIGGLVKRASIKQEIFQRQGFVSNKASANSVPKTLRFGPKKNEFKSQRNSRLAAFNSLASKTMMDKTTKKVDVIQDQNIPSDSTKKLDQSSDVLKNSASNPSSTTIQTLLQKIESLENKIGAVKENEAKLIQQNASASRKEQQTLGQKVTLKQKYSKLPKGISSDFGRPQKRARMTQSTIPKYSEYLKNINY